MVGARSKRGSGGVGGWGVPLKVLREAQRGENGPEGELIPCNVEEEEVSPTQTRHERLSQTHTHTLAPLGFH